MTGEWARARLGVYELSKGESMTSNVSGADGTRRARLVSFVRADHRYVLLGTSVIAAAGMALSSSPRSAMSFLAGAYALEVAMYYLLAACS